MEEEKKPRRSIIRRTRDHVARRIARTNLPGSAEVARAVRTPETQTQADFHLGKAVELAVTRETNVAHLQEQCPALAKWLAGNVGRGFEQQGGAIYVGEALGVLSTFMQPKEINWLWDTYVDSSEIHKALIITIYSLPRLLTGRGLMTLVEGKGYFLSDDEKDLDAIVHAIVHALTTTICRANWKHNYEDVIAAMRINL